MTTNRLRKSLALVLILVPVIAVAAALVLAELPDPVPSHWNIHGEVDRTMARTAFSVLTLVLCGGAALAGFGFARGERPRFAIEACTFAAYLTGGLAVMTAVIASGAATAEEVELPALGLILVLGTALVAPVVVGVIWPRSEPVAAADGPAAELPRLDIGVNERVVYVEQMTSRGFALLAIASALIGVIVAVTVDLVIGAGLLAVTVAGLVLQRAVVRIDASGFRLGFGPWLRVRIPLADIRQAAPAQLSPMEWGGWGYRVRPGRRALILRGGPGLVLDLTNESRFAVTLDDPDQAAAVLNGLLARSRHGSP